MPPSGTTAGTVSDVYRPAALRLLFAGAGGIYAAIRHNPVMRTCEDP